MDLLVRTRRLLLVTQVIIFVCAVIVYFNSLQNNFALDDHIHIVNSLKIRSLESALTAFDSGIFPGNLYRPLVVLSYALTYKFFGLNPLPYHLTNILLHALISVLVFRLLFLFSNIRVAVWAALFFAVVPSATEVVANVSGRSELLSAFFLLYTLILALGDRIYIDGKLNSQRALSIFVSFLCALFSKESAVVAPLLFLLCISSRRFSWIEAKSVRTLLAIFAVALLVYLGLRVNALGSILGKHIQIDFLDNPLTGLVWYQRIVSAVPLLGRYMLLPFSVDKLSADYSFAKMLPISVWSWRLGAETFLALLVMGLALARRALPRVFWLACSWFLAAFMVTSNILFPIGTIFAERLAYLPSIGSIFLLVWGLNSLRASRILEMLVLSLLVVRAATITALRNQEWRDDQTLYAKQILISPESAKTQLNFGVVLREKGELVEAEQRFKRALEIYPRFADAYFNLGLTRALSGDESTGAQYLISAIEVNPAHIPAIDTLGRYYLRKGEPEKAKQQFQNVLEIDPEYISAQIGLLSSLVNLKQFKEAHALYLTLLREDPENVELTPFRAVFLSPPRGLGAARSE